MATTAPPNITPVQAVELGWLPSQVHLRDLKEDWTGVTSTAERRKLQNRLNQRAHRRRRMKRGDPPAFDETHNLQTAKPNDVRYNSKYITVSQIYGHAMDLDHNCRCSKPCNSREYMQLFAQGAFASFVAGSPQPSHLPSLIQYNVHAALTRNADTLGLSQLWLHYEAVSPFSPAPPDATIPVATASVATADWPCALQPTRLQRGVEHHPWIDLFPHPRLRDNMLRAFEDPRGFCDEDELCHDLAHFSDAAKQPTLLVWGVPWDVRSWEASEPLLRKWGWLLEGCGEILDATNYWRGKRGERRLTRKEVEDAIAASRPKGWVVEE
ncbi:hypothetical protein S40293_00156 [Stachybotrys chartarum IBT 40293]|nr:hypothetical protein S40293_00156 [Stachybotrys chartarum IBT 40293]